VDEGELLLAVEPGGAARPVPAGTLQAAGLLERQHLQEWIVANPQILGPGVMVVAVEYDGWVVQGGAQRDRLDVLRLGVDGRLVVAELKRGVAPDGGDAGDQVRGDGQPVPHGDSCGRTRGFRDPTGASNYRGPGRVSLLLYEVSFRLAPAPAPEAP
jgi:hypothetical protein